MKRQFFYFAGVLLCLLISCSADSDGSPNANGDRTSSPDGEFGNQEESAIATIYYGTSFGECTGFCSKSIEVSDELIWFNALQNTGDASDNVRRVQAIRGSYWDVLLSKINLNDFVSLKPVIGCPDCADGGAEWIEIKGAEVDYKITFEYLNEPEVIRDMVRLLRAYQDAFETDDDKQLVFNDIVLVDQLGTIDRSFNVNASHSFLINVTDNGGNQYYFDGQLPANLKVDNAQVSFHGVLKKESTIIFKPSSTEVDFEARNITIF